MCEITRCGSHPILPDIKVSSNTRRQFVKGLIGLPLATVLAVPALSRAAAASTETITLTTTGGKQVNAALALPDNTDAPSILLIHEWWGLNDQIKSVAAELANQGYIALAVDLYDEKVATNADDARSYMQGVNGDEATDILVS